MEQVSELLELRGESLTQERIIEILSADDQDLQDRAAALIAANATDADTYHDYSRDELMAMDNNVNEDKLLGPYFLSHRDFAYNEDGRMANPERFIQAFKSKVLMYLGKNDTDCDM